MNAGPASGRPPSALAGSASVSSSRRGIGAGGNHPQRIASARVLAGRDTSERPNASAIPRIAPGGISSLSVRASASRRGETSAFREASRSAFGDSAPPWRDEFRRSSASGSRPDPLDDLGPFGAAQDGGQRQAALQQEDCRRHADHIEVDGRQVAPRPRGHETGDGAQRGAVLTQLPRRSARRWLGEVVDDEQHRRAGPLRQPGGQRAAQRPASRRLHLTVGLAERPQDAALLFVERLRGLGRVDPEQSIAVEPRAHAMEVLEPELRLAESAAGVKCRDARGGFAPAHPARPQQLVDLPELVAPPDELLAQRRSQRRRPDRQSSGRLGHQRQCAVAGEQVEDLGAAAPARAASPSVGRLAARRLDTTPASVRVSPIAARLRCRIGGGSLSRSASVSAGSMATTRWRSN